MTRAQLGLLAPIWLASACGRDVSTTAALDASAATVAATEDGGGLPIIAVLQRVIPVNLAEWTFDPSGRFVAVEHFDDDGRHCTVWEVESGLLVRDDIDSDSDVDSDPCSAWPSGSLFDRSPAHESADGALRAAMSDSAIEFEGGGSSISGCTSCGEALVWAPTGHQLATCTGQRLEIWDANTGELVRSDELALDGVTIDVFMTWTSAGLVVVTTREITGTCAELNVADWNCETDDYGYDHEPAQITGYSLSSLWWPPNGDPPQHKDHHRGLDIPEVYADPGAHWLLFSDTEDYDRSGELTMLYVSGVMGQSSALGWTDQSSGSEHESEDAQGAWRVDAATQWIEFFSIESVAEYYSLELGWRATVAEPNPGFHRETVFRSEGVFVDGTIEVLGAASGAAVTVWEVCGMFTDDDGSCKSGLDTSGAGDCEVLDVSPLLALALVDCDGALSLIEARGAGASFSALSSDANSTWYWGRSNWLALLEPGGKLGVIDLGTGRVVHEHDDVIAVPEVPLAAQHDLLPIQYADHLEFVDGASGERRIDLVGKHQGAALSPDGKQLAVIADGQARVIEIASHATITRFAVGDAVDIAWRQDGAALFYGVGWPDRAADPKTGESLGELTHPILDSVEPGELDPSWRWIHRPDGSITRTLDFTRIELGANWARLDSGVYDGEPSLTIAALRFRIGDDPESLPVYTLEELEPWLRKPGLVQAFFTGEPLPRPTIPAAAAAKLEARR